MNFFIEINPFLNGCWSFPKSLSVWTGHRTRRFKYQAEISYENESYFIWFSKYFDRQMLIEMHIKIKLHEPTLTWQDFVVVQLVYDGIDAGDGCSRRNVLATILDVGDWINTFKNRQHNDSCINILNWSLNLTCTSSNITTGFWGTLFKPSVF